MHSQGMKAMVLAAGVGSRLDPLTRLVPKPLVPFVNVPVMEYIQRLLSRHGITQTISNLHYLPEKVPAYFGDGSRLGMQMSFVNEPTLSGDAGGMRACRSFLEDGTFLVVMGDLVTDMDLSYVINQHKDKGALATVALKQVEDVERFGIAVLDSDGLITGFQEKPQRTTARSNLASTGIYVFEPEIFEHVASKGEVGFGKNVFPSLIDKGLPVLGVEVYGYWSDVGTIAQYQTSTFDAVQGLIDLDLPGKRSAIGYVAADSSVGNGCLIDGLVVLGSNSHIENGVRVKGYAVIGDNCIIGRGTVLEDAIVWNGTTIGTNAQLKNSIVGSNVYIEAGSKLFNTATVEPAKCRNEERLHIAVDNTSPHIIQSPLNALWDAEWDSESA